MKALVMLAAVATSALLVIPTVANAQTVTTAQVSYADLDLTVTADRNKLHARVARTRPDVCEPGMRGSTDVDGKSARQRKGRHGSYHSALKWRAPARVVSPHA